MNWGISKELALTVRQFLGAAITYRGIVKEYLMIIMGYFFLFLNKNICCGYSLEAPWWGTSNEYPQYMFLWRTVENYPIIISEYSSLTVPLTYMYVLHQETRKKYMLFQGQKMFFLESWLLCRLNDSLLISGREVISEWWWFPGTTELRRCWPVCAEWETKRYYQTPTTGWPRRSGKYCLHDTLFWGRKYWDWLLGSTQNIYYPYALTLTCLWANSADDKLVIFFFLFLENSFWNVMQIVSDGDNLHEIS